MTDPHDHDRASNKATAPEPPSAAVQKKGVRRMMPVLIAVIAVAVIGYGIIWGVWNDRFDRAPTGNAGGVDAETAAEFQGQGAGAANPDPPTSPTGQPRPPSETLTPNVNRPVPSAASDVQ